MAKCMRYITRVSGLINWRHSGSKVHDMIREGLALHVLVSPVLFELHMKDLPAIIRAALDGALLTADTG